MVTKIFLTGATGFVGGTAHAHIAEAHPDFEFTLLVRSEEKAKPIKARYPNAKFLFGSITDEELVEKAAAEADIVIHTADSSDNVPGANAIARGIAKGHSADRPGHWIHTSGTNILTWYDHREKRYGQSPLPEQKYHDIDDVERIVNLPDDADHRNVDKIVQAAAANESTKVAIVCPPTIYGVGSGAVNTRSIQVPDMIKGTLEKGFAPIVEPGRTEWDNVHVQDLARLFLLLVEAALDPQKSRNPDIFGPRAYYFAENGFHPWAEVANWVAKEVSKQGYLPEPMSKFVSQREVELMDGVATPSYGANSKGVAQRARKFLGWRPHEKSMFEEMPNAVAIEAKALGLEPKEPKN